MENKKFKSIIKFKERKLRNISEYNKLARKIRPKFKMGSRRTIFNYWF